MGDPVLYVSDPAGFDTSQRARFIDDLEKLNQLEFEATNNPEIATRIAQYEMAFRMQTSVPELTDLSKEPEHTFELYGPDSRKPGTFAANCLLARRLAERGVRFIQLYHRAWDHHTGLPEGDPDDVPAGRSAERGADPGPEGARPAGRHAGHLGRRIRPDRVLPGQADGRRLRPRPSPACFTIWMAGGGIKPGITLGETDDYCYNITAGPGAHPRSERDDPAVPGDRSHAADVQVPGAALPADRHRRPRRPEGARIRRRSCCVT